MTDAHPVDYQKLSLEELETHAYTKHDIVAHTLSDGDLVTKCPLDNGRHIGPTSQNLGSLAILPLEVLFEILLDLDVLSVTAFRRVNRKAMSLVDSLHEYGMIYAHCPDVLRAILATEAKHITMRALFAVLCTWKCVCCSMFGQYFSVVACKRLCHYHTVSTTRGLVSLRHAVAVTGSSKDDIKRELPHVRCIPGRYTSERTLYNDRVVLLEYYRVIEKATRDRYEGDVSLLRLPWKNQRRLWLYSYMALVEAPYFASSSEVDWGYHCLRCKYNSRATDQPNSRDKYTKSGLRSHLQSSSHKRRADR